MRHGAAQESVPVVQPVSGPPSFLDEPAGVEAQIAQLFRVLRRLKQQSIPNIAAIFNTRVDAIQALEQGDVACLPPWPETARLVCAYTASVGIDARPVLELIRCRLEQRIPVHKPAAPTTERVGMLDNDQSASAGASGRMVSASSHLGAPFVRLRRLRRPSGRVMVLLFAVLVLGTVFSATILQASASGLPQPVAGLLRGISDFVLWHMAPVRDGHRWIEVDDPRSRRGNKLQSSRT